MNDKDKNIFVIVISCIVLGALVGFAIGSICFANSYMRAGGILALTVNDPCLRENQGKVVDAGRIRYVCHNDNWEAF
jgi:hypothetical protein